MKKILIGGFLLFTSIAFSQVKAVQVKVNSNQAGIVSSNSQDAFKELKDQININNAKVTNTDNQDLTLTGTALSIENGNTANFTGWDTDASDDFNLTGNQSVLGLKDYTDVYSTLIKGSSFYVGGGTRTANTQRWSFGKDGADLLFQYQTSANTSIAGFYNELYRLNSTGTPTNAEDLTDKAYVDAQVASGSGTDDQTAAEVTIADAGSIITGVNVETALQENRTAIDLNTAKVTNTDAQTLSLTGSGNKSLAISGGNTIAIPTLANADQSTPAATTRRIIAGSNNVTGGQINLEDSSGRVKMFVRANDISAAEGTMGIAEEVTFFESTGTEDDIIDINFDFDTGTDRTLVMTPSDITYAGTSLLGGGTPNDNSVTNIKLADNAVTNAKVATAANIDATKLGTGIINNTEFNSLDGINSNIQDQFNNLSGIPSNTAEVSGSDAITNIISMTQAEYNAGPKNASTYHIVTDADPARLITGGAITMNSYIQIDDRATDTGTFTLSSPARGGIAEVEILRTSAPTLAGTASTEITGTTGFKTATRQLLTFKVMPSGDVYHFYTDL